MADPLERAAEMEQLAALLADAKAGRGQVCVVEGPSGIGKSRLLEACADLANAEEMQVLRVRCSELSRDHPFGVVQNLFGPELARAGRAMRARLMQGPASLAEPVFGQGVAADEFAVTHGLYWLTVNFVEQCPLALLVDDLSWADESSQRFFAYLAERLDDLPAAFVATIRTGDPGSESALVGSVWDATTTATIRPAALSAQAIEALLSAALPDRDVHCDVIPSVMQLTGGNPFFVVAVANAMRSGEDVGSTTPGSVRRQIARRLGRLDPNASALAKAASVIGDGTSLRDVSRLAALGTDHTHGIVQAERLVNAQLFGSSDPVTFAHSIIREATYDLLSAEERLTMHAKAARVLAETGAEPEVIAEHLLLSTAGDDPWALGVLHEAGLASSRKGAHNAALRYLRHAVQAADASRLPPRLLIDLGLSEAAAGEVLSLNRFEKALEMVHEPAQRADAMYSLGETLYRFGRFAEAAATFHYGAEFFGTEEPQIRVRFQGAAWSSEVHLSPTHGVPPDATADDDHDDGALLAVRALRDSLTTPPAAAAATLALRSLGDGALLAAQGAQGPSVNLATAALFHCGLLAEANEVVDATLNDALERGAELAYAEAALLRALIVYSRGRIADAAADAQAALDRLEHRGHVYANKALAILVHCMIERGELDEAAQMFKCRDAQLAATPALNAYVCVARARVHLSRNEIPEAISALNELQGPLNGDTDLNPTILPWRSVAGIAAHRVGDVRQSRRLFDEELGLARSFGVPITIGIALRRRASTESGEEAVATLRESVDTLRPTEALLHLGHAEAGLGRGLRRLGLQVEAREHLTIALDLAFRCGATALEKYTREELIAAGGRPRRPLLSGVESLTPTEIRIAHLAAQGLHNRDIAERLFVSRNTIAWHLRNVYRKLNVESRDQLKRHLNP
jgi:DNA-binding CsgD family transcriptional regulator/tetratricopeptide (TPR) repeat protein